MSDLELTLQRLGGEIEWPATPDIAASVALRIHVSPARPRPRLRIRRPLAIALAALAVTGGGAYAAIPDFRDWVKDVLGTESVKIERLETLPRPVPGADLGLGTRMSLDRAKAKLAYQPLIPTALPRPDSVWFSEEPVGGQLGLVYRGGELLFTQYAGTIAREYIQKFLSTGTVERVRIGADRGLWISGGLHGFAYSDHDGDIREDTMRLAGPTLLWRRDSFLLRLEGARSKAEALGIARSVAP